MTSNKITTYFNFEVLPYQYLNHTIPIPSTAKWIACDKDGSIYVYFDEEPPVSNTVFDSFTRNSGNLVIKDCARIVASLEYITPDWQDSLEKVDFLKGFNIYSAELIENYKVIHVPELGYYHSTDQYGAPLYTQRKENAFLATPEELIEITAEIRKWLVKQ